MHEYPNASERLAIWNGQDPANDCYSPISVLQLGSDGANLGINFFNMFLENGALVPADPLGKANGYDELLHGGNKQFLAMMQPNTRVESWEQ
jgi:hypothetical protein